MNLTHLLRKQVDAEIRFRGQEYFRNEQVEKAFERDNTFYFQVAGTHLYAAKLVLIEPDTDGVRAAQDLVLTVQAGCSCPHFETGSFCKHIWASCLLLEKNLAAQSTPLSMRIDKLKNARLEILEEVPTIDEVQQLLTEKNRSELIAQTAQEDYTPIWQKEIQRVQARLQERESEKKKKEVLFSPLRKQYLPREGHFVLDLDQSLRKQKFVVVFYGREFLKGGKLGVLKPVKVSKSLISIYPDEADQNLLWNLLGYTQETGYGMYRYENELGGIEIEPQFADKLLLDLSRSERFYISGSKGGAHQITPDTPFPLVEYSRDPWILILSCDETEFAYRLSGHLQNSMQCRELSDDTEMLGPYTIMQNSIAPADFMQQMTWYEVIKKNRPLVVPKAEMKNFLALYFSDAQPPELRLPPGIEIPENALQPKTQLLMNFKRNSSLIEGQVQFLYGSKKISAKDTSEKIFSFEEQCFYIRDFIFEQNEFQRFLQLGPELESNSGQYIFKENQFLKSAESAIQMGWQVLAHHQPLSVGKKVSMNLQSGIDWFDLKANFEFSNGLSFTLPQLLSSLQSGERLIRLGDGSYGLLPVEWLEKFGPLAQFGKIEDDALRLSPVQALFLSSILATDAAFAKSERFKTFTNLISELRSAKEVEASSDFHGILRPYQKQGLFWLKVLSQNKLGGVLADDMGLGKTIQVLAMLGEHKSATTLIVAPKSLIYNWIAEAEKFSPNLKVLNLTGSDRHQKKSSLSKYNIVLTTYQTLRMDIEKIKEFKFDYFIMDEAHYIKNSESQSYMACRMIQADNKIALTGTPIENSVTDLLSILSIVCPGLLPDNLNLQKDRDYNKGRLKALSQALKPFIMRRTKDQVLKELPEKTEQILYCELSAPERARYDELRNFYWGNLTKKFEEKGFEKSKIEVLEALLRLRQAACHLGLLDQKKTSDPSAKFGLLLTQLEEIMTEGHKVLVFSQFTSLLKILGEHLKRDGIAYEYLDGKTTNRQERIDRFQADPEIKVFLISLKAGGVGLNLTAANYVFILDPWWNPQAESQAIDRVHRIGQKQNVFAYKIIAKNTVEEKVLQLQKTKRELAESMLGDGESATQSVFKKLKLEDLSILFS